MLEKKGREHRADEEHVEDVPASLLEDRVVDEGRDHAHENDVDRKRHYRIRRKLAPRPEEEDDRGMDEKVERIHAEEARRHDVVADDCLEDDRRSRNREPGSEHHDQARRAKSHCVAEEFRIDEGELVERRGNERERDERRHRKRKLFEARRREGCGI